ncbi:MAG: diaminopimelate decarboxylase [Caldilineaceae bacterium]
MTSILNSPVVDQRLALFPLTTSIDPVKQRLTIAGCDLVELAATYGTPLYLFDEATLEDAVKQYRTSLATYYPGPSDITFAGKAWMSIAAAQWADRHQLWLDCTGAGELYVAKAAGAARERILVHGVNKSDEDLHAALTQAGCIVVDNLSELRRIQELRGTLDTAMPELWIRVRPGVAVDTHAYRQTGQEDSKFGMSLAEAVQAILFCQEQGLSLRGLHFHQGSHFHDPAPIGPALETIFELIAELHQQTGWTPGVISPGGGWGVPYHEDDLPHPSIEEYVAFVSEKLREQSALHSLPLPRLQPEPGRSLVARAGVALYRVGAVKHSASRRWLMIDGGMADNPRPALYGARYSALPVEQPNRPLTSPAWFGGPFCESGDVLIQGLPMPEIAEGELVAVPVVGAYQLNMGSNYNGARKPAVVWLRGGKSYLIQRRETVEQLILRDLPLPE